MMPMTISLDYWLWRLVLDLIVFVTWSDEHGPPKTRREQFWHWVRRLVFLALVAGMIVAIWQRF
jgi:hypothetical protein